MGFNEKVHAFIAAKFYVYLTEAFGEAVARPCLYPRHSVLCRAAWTPYGSARHPGR